jgi:hypothetical protein
MNGTLQELAAILQGFGRGGDTMLAHITPSEAMLLDQVTDGGSVNPITGIAEFYMGEGGYMGGNGGGVSGFGGEGRDSFDPRGELFGYGTGPTPDGAYNDIAGSVGDRNLRGVVDDDNLQTINVPVPEIDKLKEVDPFGDLVRDAIADAKKQGQDVNLGFKSTIALDKPAQNLPNLPDVYSYQEKGPTITPDHALDQLADINLKNDLAYRAKLNRINELEKEKALLPGVNLNDPQKNVDPRVEAIDNELTALYADMTQDERNRMNVGASEVLDAIFDVGVGAVIPGGGLVQAAIEKGTGVNLGHLSDLAEALSAPPNTNVSSDVLGGFPHPGGGVIGRGN